MENSSEFRNKLNLSTQQINELNELLKQYSYKQNENNNIILPELGSKIKDHYQIAIEGVNNLINLVDKLIGESTESDPNSLPTLSEVRHLYDNFWDPKIKTKAAPIPVHCGCYANRNKQLNRGDFICGKYEDKFILLIVYKHHDDICEVFDPEKALNENGEIHLFQLKVQEWVSLPTIVPEKPLARWEFAKNSKVLSLWKDNAVWTTEFYVAEVISRPCDNAERLDNRCYLLRFDESNEIEVPEKYVVHLDPNWIKK